MGVVGVTLVVSWKALAPRVTRNRGPAIRLFQELVAMVVGVFAVFFRIRGGPVVLVLPGQVELHYTHLHLTAIPTCKTDWTRCYMIQDETMRPMGPSRRGERGSPNLRMRSSSRLGNISIVCIVRNVEKLLR